MFNEPERRKTPTKENILLLDVMMVRINARDDVNIRLKPFLGGI